MFYAIVSLTVKDYEQWKQAFDQASPLRKSHGSRGVRVFRSLETPNKLMILGDYEDLQKAKQLFQSPEFREATQRAGTIGAPEVMLADEVYQLPA